MNNHIIPHNLWPGNSAEKDAHDMLTSGWNGAAYFQTNPNVLEMEAT